MRMLFFGDRPGTEIGLGDKPNDNLLFVGLEGGQLYFIRKVDASKDGEKSILGKSFQEEMWYEKGKGLVRLVQTQSGKVDMTWRLVQFLKGR